MPVRLALDTGFPGPLRLTPLATKRVGLDRSTRPTQPWMRHGHEEGTLIRADSVVIGDVALGTPVVHLDERASDTFPDGLIGLRSLRLLNLATDPASGDLWIKRNRLPPLADTAPYATL